MTYRPATEADVQFFAEHGWIVVEDVIDPSDLVAVEQRCDEIIADKDPAAPSSRACRSAPGRSNSAQHCSARAR